MPANINPQSPVRPDQKKPPQRAGSETYFEPLLSDTQAAQLLGNMHPRTLQRLARSRLVPAIKIGRFWFFRASALNEWIGVQSEHRPCFSKETT
jgi:excisionase family DNA binding protein